MPSSKKPLGCRNYGSIPHLPGSRLGLGDKCLDEGMTNICTKKLRDKFDRIYLEEKLDGSNVGVCKVRGKIVAIQRKGYPVDTSPHEQHWLFGHWVRVNAPLFDKLLGEGERVAGEWLAQVHSIRYRIPCRRTPNPFVPFDLFTPDNKRVLREEFWDRLDFTGLVPTQCFYRDPIAPEDLTFYPEHGFHGALDRPEGFVYRVERRNRVDFLAKWVRPDMVPGEHLPEFSGKPSLWNWKPSLPAVVS